jgi:hypothetical protein
VNIPDRRAGDVADTPNDAGCPNVFGTYQINNTNCANANDTAPQEVRGTGCVLQFISPTDGGAIGINGTANLASNGTFSGAVLRTGTIERMPCIGSWSAADREMTITCNPGAPQECLTEILRTGP